MKRFWSLFLALAFLMGSIPYVFADDFISEEETVYMNTVNNYTLDADNTGGDVRLQFGTTLAEYLEWNDGNNQFELSDDLSLFGTALTLDGSNAGVGNDVNIVANQGSDSDGTLRYNATTNQWELSNDGDTFSRIARIADTDLDDAYNNFGANASTVTIDAAESQTGGVTFAGSLASDETLTVTNSGNGGGVLVENTGTGDGLRVNDVASDTTPFVIDDAGLVGIGTASPDTNLHLEDTGSTAATEWLKFDDGTNEVSLLTGTQDPKLVATDADIGSFFFNSSNGLFYIKQDDGSTVNWNQIGLTDDVHDALAGTSGTPSATNKYVTDEDPRLSSGTNIGESAMGNRLNYDNVGGSLDKQNIQYTRVFLPSNITIVSMGVFTDEGKTGDINMGIYDDSSGVPDSKLVETGIQSSVTSPVADFWEYNLTSSYTTTVAGFYWFAVASTAEPKSRTVKDADDEFIPYRIESKGAGSSTLPATASPDAIGNAFDISYVAGFE